MTTKTLARDNKETPVSLHDDADHNKWRSHRKKKQEEGMKMEWSRLEYQRTLCSLGKENGRIIFIIFTEIHPNEKESSAYLQMNTYYLTENTNT